MSFVRRVPRLVLASASPRRAKLLRDAGYPFEQITPPFDDSGADLSTSPQRHLAADLAYRKAASVAKGLEHAVVIGCDTLLSIDCRAAGKPADAHEARATLASLMDKPHEVITAVSLIDTAQGREYAFVESAIVTIHPLAPDDLDAYIRSGRWRGKAGGYNLAELKGEWRFDVQGDPTTVIGLPMQRLAEELLKFAPDVWPGA